jgi:hypothetical protein
MWRYVGELHSEAILIDRLEGLLGIQSSPPEDGRGAAAQRTANTKTVAQTNRWVRFIAEHALISRAKGRRNCGAAHGRAARLGSQFPSGDVCATLTTCLR